MKKIITYGTFDLFHQGHYNILKRAKEYGDYLVVGVTSESYDIERGKLNIRDSLLKRMENVKKTGFADEIIIEEYQGQKVSDIIKYNIDALVIGSDWMGKFDYLKNYCEVVYLERTKSISSTMLRNNERIYKIGIITDDIEDNDIILESKYVSGINVECVLSDELEIAKRFCEEHELDAYTDRFEDFINRVDIVYIKSEFNQRFFYIDKAIEYGKCVITDTPYSLNKDAMKGLFQKAEKNNVIIVEKIMLVFLRAFNQLVWLTHTNVIGDIIRVKCVLSREDFSKNSLVQEAIVYAICAVIKLLGMEYQNIEDHVIQDEENKFLYNLITIQYESSIATIEVGSEIKVENELTIVGKEGTIKIPNDWWNAGYFEASIKDNEFLKRYSFNFEGNGFRYLLQELMIMIHDKRTECTRLFHDESIKIIDILNHINC